MMGGMRIEVLLAAGYAVALVAIAAAIEFLARRSHQRSESFHVAGFKYHPQFDAWECPTGQRLRRSKVNHKRRIVHYRAPFHACNCCASKKNCTDSDEGREIEHRLDSWLESEIRRFHRGMSLALVLLAALILGIEAARDSNGKELVVLGSLFVPVAATEIRLLSKFLGRHHEAV